MFKSCESCALLTDSAHDFQTEVVMIACLCGAGVAFMHKGKPILPPLMARNAASLPRKSVANLSMPAERARFLHPIH
jgi:hypothetical protein